jgi:NADH-quinone oxidoreductase subunit B
MLHNRPLCHLSDAKQRWIYAKVISVRQCSKLWSCPISFISQQKPNASLVFRFACFKYSSKTIPMVSDEYGYNSKVEGEVIVTRADAVVNWIRKHSVWPMPMGLACCAIELMASAASRYDISRFGMEVMRFSPRQSDCMIVAGTVTYKMAEVVRRIYDQMGDPKWVVAMGACASTGGMYRSYAVMQGVDNVVPVDVYVSGCPPRPEALLDAMMKLQDKIGREPAVKNLSKTPETAPLS